MFDLPKYGDGVCLARLADLLDAIEVDRARLSRISVVVTGSNGKGSTAAFCANIAHAYGLRTGLFTSPHLYRFNERFQVDGVPIGDHIQVDGPWVFDSDHGWNEIHPVDSIQIG